MKSLLLIAHGSRREQANNEIKQLATYLDDTDQSFDRIDHAFLEMAEPSIQEAVDNLVKSGATEVVFLPYFLAYGAHVAKDIPAILDELREKHPTLAVSMMSHVGSTQGMKRLLLMLIQQASFRKDD